MGASGAVRNAASRRAPAKAVRGSWLRVGASAKRRLLLPLLLLPRPHRRRRRRERSSPPKHLAASALVLCSALGRTARATTGTERWGRRRSVPPPRPPSRRTVTEPLGRRARLPCDHVRCARLCRRRRSHCRRKAARRRSASASRSSASWGNSPLCAPWCAAGPADCRCPQDVRRQLRL